MCVLKNARKSPVVASGLAGAGLECSLVVTAASGPAARKSAQLKMLSSREAPSQKAPPPPPGGAADRSLAPASLGVIHSSAGKPRQFDQWFKSRTVVAGASSTSAGASKPPLVAAVAVAVVVASRSTRYAP